MNNKIKAGLIGLLACIIVANGFSLTKIQAEDNSLPVSISKKSTYVYRFWSDIFKGHFFTSSYSEATKVKDTDTNWTYEGVAFSAFNIEQKEAIPVYRFWSDVFKGHFYTADEAEMIRVRDTDSNWQYESIAYYVYPKDYEQRSQTVYRFWSPIFKHHFYTADEEEMTRVRNTDTNWDFEGPAFKVPVETDLEIKDTTETGELNETIELGDSAISVSNVTNSSDNDQIVPDEDNRLLSVMINLENIGEEEMNYSEDDFVLVDTDTQTVYQPITNVVEPGLDSGTLQPGETISGYITFEVPKTATNLSLQYINDLMAENNNQINIDFDFDPSVTIVQAKKITNNFSGEQIIGEVQNNTDDPVRYVKILATFLDSSGEEIGSNYTYAENIEVDFLLTGEKADFRIWTIRDPNVKSYTLTVTWANS